MSHSPRERLSPEPENAAAVPSERPTAPETGNREAPATDEAPAQQELPDGWSAATAVHQLAEGVLKADDLTLEQRRACVDHLSLEGFSVAEIAELMGVSERTIKRDRQAIRAAGAVEPTQALGDEVLGEFQRHTLGAVARLARLSNDPQAHPYARLWANEAIVRCYQRFAETVRKMEYFAPGKPRITAQKRRQDAAAGKGPLSMAAVDRLYGSG